MITAAVTAEYNPFHNGHKLHIEHTRRRTNADFVVAVMSGNFVQRGEPALFEKWVRTLCALKNGVDMVIELPAFFACSSAEYFASAAVSIMEKSNIVNFISFGAETDDIEALKGFASSVKDESPVFRSHLEKFLSEGLPYPAAREKALKNSGINVPVLSANNILATEYLKALDIFGSNIAPVCIKRTDNGYNSLDPRGSFASATNIRAFISNNQLSSVKSYVPDSVFEIIEKEIENQNTAAPNDLSDSLNFVLRTTPPEKIAEILDIREGIENKILKAINTEYSFSDIVSYVKSKRYSYTGVQRMLLHILLGLKAKDMAYFKNNGYCPYIRVLGFKKEAAPLIGELTKKSSVPVLINIKKDEQSLDENSRLVFEFEKKADDIYYMCRGNIKNRYPNRDYTMPPVII